MAEGTIRLTLDGRVVEARAGETVWALAARLGTRIPHLCHRPAHGYRADGNCWACVVEVEGERALVPSCRREATSGMVIKTASPRVVAARKMVFELLAADSALVPGTPFAEQAAALGVTKSRFPARAAPPPPSDPSHPAINVRMEACIHCGLCVRACREVQVNDVIAMAGRGADVRVVFDQGEPLGQSSCVGCGECESVCPTGALTPKRTGVERTLTSVCPYCGVGCRVELLVAGDRLVGAKGGDGPANRGRLCVKGRYGLDYVHHPQRLTKPLIRRDDAPKGGDDRVDPADPSTHFREASWEEATARAAAGLISIRDKHGGGALAGFGSAKGTNEEAYLFQKLVRLGFGTNNVDHCTRLCHASSVAALFETIGSGAVTAPFAECLNSDVIVVIGANPSVNHPVAASFIKNAVKGGAKLIVIDPRGQALARHATHMVRFRNGSDVALLNAVMHVIVAEGLCDRDFIAARTEGFDDLARHLEAFSPEAMAAICGVEPETVRAIARTFAGARAAMIFWGMGISQHVHGTDNARCLISLALMCGQVGRPGAGLHPLRGQNNVQGASDAGLIPMFLPGYAPVEDETARRRFEDAWGRTIAPNRGLTVVEILNAAHAGRIKGLYVMGENPAMSDPDLAHARAALAALDHLVVQDLFLTETAWHADVILPASAFPEKTGTVTSTDRRVQMGRAALAPPGQARLDLDIVVEMGRRLGLSWAYDGPGPVFEEMRALLPGFEGISWERLEREDAVTYPCPDPDRPGSGVIFAERFPTPSGRGRFVPASFIPPDDPLDDDYPMVLSTGRLLEHWHTGAMTRRAPVLDAIEPGAVVLMAPDDLDRLGVVAGEVVRIITRRGSVAARARRDPDIAPGTLFMPFCFVEGAANELTNPRLDPYGKIPEFKYSAARLEKTRD